ncbi:histidine phosphotransferase family protein [Sabulicella glaciei]|uniref:Histidine phosphotransferase family protein n=1 Tax=Sabulicella glaciei TaxID=2984948 RepID=A0ABT3NTL6_9PROT|nr:histidine phosphotransferase family protein [Roseococcus sp. MDT2-1-1]MCW8085502.1 histidine phosphotransferase family protein [Roseococcus sp. MDT2-1-1]
MDSLDKRLSETVAARLCHDLVSPLSTLTALMPQSADAAAQALLCETAEVMRRRLHLFCLLFGAMEETSWQELPALLRGSPAAHRVRFGFGGIPVALNARTARLLAGAALLGAEALPRGGEVSVTATEADGFTLLPAGRGAAWPEAALRLAAGGDVGAALEEGPRRILSPWVFLLARAAGRPLNFALPGGSGIPALVVSAPG